MQKHDNRKEKKVPQKMKVKVTSSLSGTSARKGSDKIPHKGHLMNMSRNSSAKIKTKKKYKQKQEIEIMNQEKVMCT